MQFFFGACFQGNVNMLRKYFNASTDIDKKRARILSKDSSDRTALHFACDSGALDVVQLLISNGAIESICVFDSDGCTPLHRAVRNGSSDVVKFLLEAQKKHNKKYLPIVLNAITSDTTKRTALHIAALERKHEIAKLLLQYGADKNMKDKFGNEPKAYGLVQFDEGGSSEHHDCCIPGKGGKQYRSGMCCV